MVEVVRDLDFSKLDAGISRIRLCNSKPVFERHPASVLARAWWARFADCPQLLIARPIRMRQVRSCCPGLWKDSGSEFRIQEASRHEYSVQLLVIARQRWTENLIDGISQHSRVKI
jgi:hypothetical protein